MLEQALAKLLNVFLGEFVEGTGDGTGSATLQEKITVGVWSGYIVLEDLVLKDKLLSILQLPVTLSHGVIGRLEFRIPWAKLGVEPVVIVVDRVNILLEPKYQWDLDARENREQTIKQAKLVAAEIFAAKRLVDNSSGPFQGYRDFVKKWLMDSILNKIVDNVQITVRDIHIRYEDHVSCPSDFCIGASLESLHAQSRDVDSPSSEGQTDTTPLHSGSKDLRSRGKDVDIKGNCFSKLIQTDHLAVYWNPLYSKSSSMDPCTTSFVGRTRKEIDNLMFRTIARRNQFADRPLHHYILVPVDIRTDLDAKVDTTTGATEVKALVSISQIDIVFEDRQYREIVSFLANMANFAKLEECSRFRPVTSIAAAKAALSTNSRTRSGSAASRGEQASELRRGLSEVTRAWWRYAFNAVVYQIRKERSGFAWKDLIDRRNNKYVYVELWKRKLSPLPSSSSRSKDRESAAVSTPDCADSEDIRKSPLFERILAEHIKVAATAASNSEGSKKKARRSSTVPYSEAEGRELLRRLELLLPFEDIVFFRSIAEKDFSSEERQRGLLQSMYAWATGGKEAPEEEKRKLFEALKYAPERVFDPKKASSDPEAAVATINVMLERGSVRLALSAPVLVAEAVSLPFLELQFHGLQMKTNVLAVGATMDIRLHDLEIYELLTNDIPAGAFGGDSKADILIKGLHKYNCLVSRRLQKIKESTNRSPWVREASAVSPMSQDTSPLFEGFIQISPPASRHLDVDVQIVLKELIIILSPAAPWVNSVNTFFTWPVDLEFWSEMEMKAMNQIADFKSRVDAKLEYVIRNHSNVAINADIKAPVLVVSESGVVSEGFDMLVVDLGNIGLRTEKLAKAVAMSEKKELNSNAGFTSDATTNKLGLDEELTPLKHTTKVTAMREYGPAAKDTKRAAPDKETKYISDPEDDERSDEALSVRSASDRDSTRQSTRQLSVSPESLGEDRVATPTQDPLYRPEGLGGLVQSSASASQLINDVDGGRYDRRGRRNDYGNGPSTAGTQAMDLDVVDSDGLFDIFQVTIKDVEVYMTGSIDSIFSASTAMLRDNKVSKTVGIVDRFDISLEVQVSVLPWDPTIPPVKLYLDFPEINVRLSDRKLFRLASFSRHLAESSKALIDANRGKVNKLIAAIEQRRLRDKGKRAGSSSSASARASSRKQGERAAKSKSGREVDLEDDISFYDVESDRRSGSTDRQGRARVLSRDRPVKPVGTPHRRSTISESSSVLSDGKTPSRQRLWRVSSNSPAVDFNKLMVPRAGSVNSGTWRSHRSEASYKSFRSLGERTVRRGAAEDDSDSDDSFLSVEDCPEDVLTRMESLHYTIKAKENICTKLMAELRMLEHDTSSKGRALQKALQEELDFSQEELKQHKVRYVDICMLVDSSKQATEDGVALSSGNNNNSNTNTMDINDLLDTLLMPVKGQEDFDRMRKLMKSSVFKAKPKASSSEKRKKELFHLEVNVSVVNVILSCAQPGSSQSTEEVDVLRCRLASATLTLKHRNYDSRLSVLMQELDVEDVIYSTQSQREGGNPIFLLSSEPVASGVMISQDAYEQSDLLNIKYHVVYGSGDGRAGSTAGSTAGDDGKTTISDNESVRTSSTSGGAEDSSHQLRIAIGFVGVNVIQETVVTLLNTASTVSSALRSTRSKQQSFSLPEQKPKEQKPFRGGVDLNMSLKSKGLAFTVVHNNRPFVGLTAWSFQLWSQLSRNKAHARLTVADVSIADHSASSSAGLLHSKQIILRRSNESVPSLLVVAVADLLQDYVVFNDFTVRTASTAITVVPSFLASLTAVLAKGSVATHLRSQQTGHISKPLAMPKPLLERTLGGLLRSCGGHCDVTISEVELTVLSSYGNSNFYGSGRQHPNLHQGGQGSGKGQASIGFSRATVTLRWGEQCAFRGLEASLTALGVRAALQGCSVVEPFDVFALVAARAEEDTSQAAPAPPTDAAEEPPERLMPDTPFAPDFVRDVLRNRVYVSASTSPIIVHASERLLHECGSLYRENDRHLQAMLRNISAEHRAPSQVAKVTEEATSMGIGIGAGVQLRYRAYELALSLDADVSAAAEAAETSSALGLKVASSSPFKSPTKKAAAAGNASLYYLSLRDLRVSFSEHPRGTGNEPSVNFNSSFDDVSDSNEEQALELSVQLRTVDFCYRKPEEGQTLRLLTTSAPGSRFSSSESPEQYSPSALESSSDRGDSADALGDSAAEVSAIVSRDLGVVCCASISNLQVLLATDAVAKMVTLLHLCGESYKSSAQGASSDFQGSRLERVLAEERLRKRAAEEDAASSLLRDTFNAPPSSMPLSTSLEAGAGTGAARAQRIDSARPVVLLEAASFALPRPMLSFRLSLRTRGCGIWLPSDASHSASFQNAHALHLTFNASLEGEHHGIDWRLFDRSSTLQQQPQQCWSSHLAVDSLQVYTSKVQHPQIFTELPPLRDPAIQPSSLVSIGSCLPPRRFFSKEELSSPPVYRRPRGGASRGGRDGFAQKMILLPTNATVSHSITVAPYAPEASSSEEAADPINGAAFAHCPCEIKQTLNVVVHEMELLAHLDVATLRKTVEATLLPLAQLAPSAQTPQDREEGEREDPNPGPAPAEGSTLVLPKSLFHLLPHILAMSTYSVKAVHEGARLFVIDDLHSHPVTIARLCQGRTEALLTCLAPRGADKEEVAQKNLSLKCSASFGIDYHNQILMVWEPLLEPFDWSLDFSSAHAPEGYSGMGLLLWESAAAAPEALAALSASVAEQRRSRRPGRGSSDLKIDIARAVNINVTATLLQILTSLVESLGSAESKKGSDGDELPFHGEYYDSIDGDFDHSATRIRNETGLPMHYHCSDNRSQQSRAVEVPSGRERPLSLDEQAERSLYEDRLFDPMAAMTSVSLTFDLPSGAQAAITSLPLAGNCCRLYMHEEGGVAGTPSSKRASPTQPFARRTNELYSATYQMMKKSRRSLCIAAELSCRDGVRTVVLRSTLRMCNALQVDMRVQVVSRLAFHDQAVLWDGILLANSDLSLPANLCGAQDAHVVVRPLLTSEKFSNAAGKDSRPLLGARVPLKAAALLVPEFEAQSWEGADEPSAYADSLASLGLPHAFDLLASKNVLKCRLAREQRRGSADTVTYAHWLAFPSDDPGVQTSEGYVLLDEDSPQHRSKQLGCALVVSARGIPRANNNNSYADSCLSRVLTFTPTVTVKNLLATSIEAVLYSSDSDGDGRTRQEVLRLSMDPGEEFGCLAFHAIEDIALSLKIVSSKNAAREATWSDAVSVAGALAGAGNATTTLSTSVAFPNGSRLTVLIDVTDFFGCRTINVYVPYWVVTSSFLPLQYQHYDGSMLSKRQDFNGSDELAADQPFDLKAFDGFFDSGAARSSEKLLQQQRASKFPQSAAPPRGIGKCRSKLGGGVKLGPELPVRGLADILRRVRSGESGRLVTRLEPGGRSVLPGGDLGAVDGLYDLSTITHSQYRLMQCSYSTINKTGSLRLRASGTNWSSSPFQLDAVGSTSCVDAESVRGYTEPEDTPSNWTVGKPPPRQGHQLFSFGVMVVSADPPFQRTKVAIVVDRYVLINSMGQTIEVRQFAMEEESTVTTVGANDETAFWWRPGKQFMQVRLAMYGWIWSGKFPVSSEGGVPLRLRNEHDNTVFFILVQVIKRGPRIFILFKGGGSIAPYRIENHTWETFRFSQVDGKKQHQWISTPLLPYHACPYAWDEPLAAQQVRLEVVKGARGELVGLFAFDAIYTEPPKKDGGGFLLVRLVANGPTRVLQIYDVRDKDIRRSLRSLAAPQQQGSGWFGDEAALTGTSAASPDSSTTLQIAVNVAHVGVSIIDHQPQELLYLSLLDSRLLFASRGEGGRDSLNLNVGNVQVDCQLFTAVFPSVLYPMNRLAPEARARGQGLVSLRNGSASEDFLSINVERDFGYPGILYIPLFQLRLLPFEVNVEGTLITRIFNMVDAFLSSDSDGFSDIHNFVSLKKMMSSGAGTRQPFPATPHRSGDMRNSMNQQLLQLLQGEAERKIVNATVSKLLLSTNPPKQMYQSQLAKVYVEKVDLSELDFTFSLKALGINPLLNRLTGDHKISNLLNTIVTLFFNNAFVIENIPLKFQPVTLEHSFLTGSEVSTKLTQNYVNYAKIFNIILSTNIIAIIGRKLAMAVTDVVKQTSLLAAGTVRRLLFLDTEYYASSLGAISSGLVAMEPPRAGLQVSKSLQASGAAMYGLRRALGGVAATLMPARALREKYHRVRPPRFSLSRSVPLKPYETEENIGQELLSRVNGGEFRNERCVWQGRLLGDTMLVLTPTRLVAVEPPTHGGGAASSLAWHSVLSEMSLLEVQGETAPAEPEAGSQSNESRHRKPTPPADENGTGGACPVLHVYHLPNKQKLHRPAKVGYLMRLITGGGDVGGEGDVGFSSGLGGLKLHHRVIEMRSAAALETFLELLVRHSQLAISPSSSPTVYAFLRERGADGFDGPGARKRQLAVDSESDSQRRSPVTTPQNRP